MHFEPETAIDLKSIKWKNNLKRNRPKKLTDPNLFIFKGFENLNQEAVYEQKRLIDQDISRTEKWLAECASDSVDTPEQKEIDCAIHPARKFNEQQYNPVHYEWKRREEEIDYYPETYLKTAKLLEFIKKHPCNVRINWKKIPEKETSWFFLTYRVLPKLEAKYLELFYDIDFRILGMILYHIRNHALRDKDKRPLECNLIDTLKWNGSGVWDCCAISQYYMSDVLDFDSVRLGERLQDMTAMGLIDTRHTKKVGDKNTKTIKHNPNVYFILRPLMVALIKAFYARYPEAFLVQKYEKEEQDEYIKKTKENTALAKEERLKSGIYTQILGPREKFITVKDNGQDKVIKSCETVELSGYGVKTFIDILPMRMKKKDVQFFMDEMEQDQLWNVNKNTEQKTLEKCIIVQLHKTGRLAKNIYNQQYVNKDKKKINYANQPTPTAENKRFTLQNFISFISKKKPLTMSYRKYVKQDIIYRVRNAIIATTILGGLDIHNKKVQEKMRLIENYMYACHQDFVTEKKYGQLNNDDGNFREVCNEIVRFVYGSNFKLAEMVDRRGRETILNSNSYYNYIYYYNKYKEKKNIRLSDIKLFFQNTTDKQRNVIWKSILQQENVKNGTNIPIELSYWANQVIFLNRVANFDNLITENVVRRFSYKQVTDFTTHKEDITEHRVKRVFKRVYNCAALLFLAKAQEEVASDILTLLKEDGKFNQVTEFINKKYAGKSLKPKHVLSAVRDFFIKKYSLPDLRLYFNYQSYRMFKDFLPSRSIGYSAANKMRRIIKKFKELPTYCSERAIKTLLKLCKSLSDFNTLSADLLIDIAFVTQTGYTQKEYLVFSYFENPQYPGSWSEKETWLQWIEQIKITKPDKYCTWHIWKQQEA